MLDCLDNFRERVGYWGDCVLIGEMAGCNGTADLLVTPRF
jgi:hypothetical protein